MTESRRRKPRRGRRQGLSDGATGQRTEYRHLGNPLIRAQSFSADHVAQIHETALRVLEELGLRVLLPAARDYFRRAGAIVDDATMMVRIDRSLVEQALASAPSVFDMMGGAPPES